VQAVVQEGRQPPPALPNAGERNPIVPQSPAAAEAGGMLAAVLQFPRATRDRMRREATTPKRPRPAPPLPAPSTEGGAEINPVPLDPGNFEETFAATGRNTPERTRSARGKVPPLVPARPLKAAGESR
jgi:hypothetical protein